MTARPLGMAPNPSGAAPRPQVLPGPEPQGSVPAPEGGIPPQDQRWFLGLVVFLIFLTTIPYALAWLRQGEAWRFTGFLLAVEDGNSYLAKMLLGRSGAWLFRSPYTLVPQGRYGLFGPYLLLGKLARLPGDLHTQLMVLFHLFRLGALVALAWSTYRLVARFVPLGPWRRWAVVLVLAGSGLDWVLLPWGRVAWGDADGPPSLISPEAYGFLILLVLPHLALARALLFALLSDRLRGVRARTLTWKTALMVWAHPLEAVAWLLVLGFWGLVRLLRPGVGGWRARGRDVARWLRPALPSVGVALAAAGYLYALQCCDPYVRLWTAQNRLPAPPLWVYALGYGGLGLLGLGAWQRLRQRWQQGEAEALLPVAWALGAPLLAVAPVPIQRRLVEGVWLAWVVWGMEGAQAWAVTPRRRAVLTATLPLALVAPALLLWGMLQVAQRPAFPAFRPAEEVQAFEALAQRAAYDDAVMAAYPTGNALPAWTPVRVPLGLGPESAPRAENEALVRMVYAADTPPEARRALWARWGVRWVFWGPAERALGDWHPSPADGVVLRFRAGPFAVYEVRP